MVLSLVQCSALEQLCYTFGFLLYKECNILLLSQRITDFLLSKRISIHYFKRMNTINLLLNSIYSSLYGAVARLVCYQITRGAEQLNNGISGAGYLKISSGFEVVKKCCSCGYSKAN